jgi:hypothetical protein
LCDQEEENIQHLLIQCVVARQFWYYLFNQVGLSHLAPAAAESSFDDWWESVGASISGEECKGVNSLIILGAWCIWKHRNSCVFDGVAPNVAAVLNLAREESHLWSLAGAKGLAFLSIREPG